MSNSEDEIKRYVEQHQQDYAALKADPEAWNEEIADQASMGIGLVKKQDDKLPQTSTPPGGDE